MSRTFGLAAEDDASAACSAASGASSRAAKSLMIDLMVVPFIFMRLCAAWSLVGESEVSRLIELVSSSLIMDADPRTDYGAIVVADLTEAQLDPIFSSSMSYAASAAALSRTPDKRKSHGPVLPTTVQANGSCESIDSRES